MLSSMGVDLVAPLSPGAGFAAAARGWLDGVLGEVFGDLVPVMLADPAVTAVTAGNDWLPWGEPEQVRGELGLGITDPLPRRAVPFTAGAWRRFLGSLARSPLTATVSIRPLDQDGFPCRESGEITVRRSPFEPDWVRFTFSAPASFTRLPRPSLVPVPGDTLVRLPPGSFAPMIIMRDEDAIPGEVVRAGSGWPDAPEVQDRWARFVKGQAARIGACAGWMSDDCSPGGDTALETAIIGPPGGELARRRREVLYGYSWITLVPPDLARWLGGPGALTATGAFAQVNELPDGSLWLRATPTINEFTGDRVRAAFEALAPVLVTGRTTFRPASRRHPPRLVEGADAADYQSPATTPRRRPGVPPAGQETTLRQMNAALWTDRVDAGLGGAGRAWMLAVLEAMIPDLLAATSTRPATLGMPVGDPLSWPLDGPDTLQGALHVGDWHARQARYSRAGWRRLLTALDKPVQRAEIEISVVGGEGLGRGAGRVAVQRPEHAPGWTQLAFDAASKSTGWPQSPAMQDRWAQLLRQQAALTGACAGGMTDTGTPGEGLGLATRNPDASITRSRQVLQDYCWVTVVPAELAARLGGAAALRAGGAFSEASELPGGSVWLRATPTINEFNAEHIQAAFATLAPVLLTGRTEFRFGYQRHVEHADAADYQQPRT